MTEISQISNTFQKVPANRNHFHSGARGDWSVESWRQFAAKHQPTYDDAEGLSGAIKRIKTYPPLVSPGEIMGLRRQLAEAEIGRRFLLQGGDCAERFADCTPDAISEKVRLLLRMGLVMTARMGVPVIKVGRLAGQYAKPRSQPFESDGGVRRPSFRGDLIHDVHARIPDPMRMVQAYHAASLTLNYVRSLIAGGMTDLSRCEEWGTGEEPQEYRNVAMRFAEARALIGAYGSTRNDRTSVGDDIGDAREIFVSHEGLVLEFEEAMTRRDPATGQVWNLSAHTLWIGERTRGIQGAHVEYFRGLANPIGVKVGAGADPEEIAALVRILNPLRERGKLLLVTRLGAKQVQVELPALIAAVSATKVPVLWVCDPMHGNTFTTDAGMKTRSVDDVLHEYSESLKAHNAAGSRLAGIHLEMTGDPVTECIGPGVQMEDLMVNYQSYCDPRLNGQQSLEVALQMRLR